MRPRFRVDDVAWHSLNPCERSINRIFHLVILRSQDPYSPHLVSPWLTSFLGEYVHGSTNVHSVEEKHLYEALWTFTGYLKRETMNEEL